MNNSEYGQYWELLSHAASSPSKWANSMGSWWTTWKHLWVTVSWPRRPAAPPFPSKMPCSVAQLCPTVCSPMDCSMPGFPVLHHLLEFAPTCPLSWRCLPTISSSVIPFSSCHQSFPASGFFPVSWLFASGSQSIGASVSASVLPINIWDWFPLGLTGLISLQSKGFSRPQRLKGRARSLLSHSTLAWLAPAGQAGCS